MYRFSLFNLKVTRLDNRVILLVDLYSAESTSNWLSALFSDPNNFLKTRDFEVKWPWHKLTLCYLFKKLENLGPSRTYFGPKKKLSTVPLRTRNPRTGWIQHKTLRLNCFTTNYADVFVSKSLVKMKIWIAYWLFTCLWRFFFKLRTFLQKLISKFVP